MNGYHKCLDCKIQREALVSANLKGSEDQPSEFNY